MDEPNIFPYLTTVILIIVVFLLVKYLLSKPRGIPPGPYSIPLIGSIQAMRGDPRVTFPALRKKYGDVFSIYLGNTLAIAIGGANTIREALIKHGQVFSDRPHSFLNDVILKQKGIFASNGRFWKEQRTFIINKLREFGMGKIILEERIREEVETLINCLTHTAAKPMNVFDLVHRCVGNVIFNIVASKRYTHDDPEFKIFCAALVTNFKKQGTMALVNIYPSLASMPFDLFGISVLLRNCDTINDIVGKHIESHRKDFDPANIRDLIDAYLMEIEERKDDNIFNVQLGIMLITDLLAAGIETTASTLIWSVLYLSLNEHIQVKIQNEMEEVVGCDRSVSLLDKPTLPYIDATVHELQRISSIGFFAPPHCATEDTIFRGYLIPKGAPLLLMFGDTYMDPDEWDKPEVFNPERFLVDGKVQHLDKFMPFGAGRRACPGEALARMELFLFLTTILQKFSIRLPEGAPPPSTKGIYGFTVVPEPFKVCFVPR